MGCLSYKQWLGQITRASFQAWRCTKSLFLCHWHNSCTSSLCWRQSTWDCLQRQRHRCVSRAVRRFCRCLQGDGGIRGSGRSFSTMRALRIYCPASATAKRMGGFTSRDRALCNDGRWVKANPVLNSARNVSFTVTHMDSHACTSSARAQEQREFQTM